MRSGVALSWVCLLALAACAKQSGEATPSFAEPPASGDPLEFYEAQLAENEAALQAQGVELPHVAMVNGDLAKSVDHTAVDSRNSASPSGGAAPSTPMGGEAGAITEMDEAEATGADAPSEDEDLVDMPAAEPEPELAANEEAPAPSPDDSERRELARDRNKAQSRVPSRCETICGLAESTCSLEGRICELAERHAEDPRYENACGRAQGDCEVAQEACHACVE